MAQKCRKITRKCTRGMCVCLYWLRYDNVFFFLLSSCRVIQKMGEGTETSAEHKSCITSATNFSSLFGNKTFFYTAYKDVQHTTNISWKQLLMDLCLMWGQDCLIITVNYSCIFVLGVEFIYIVW